MTTTTFDFSTKTTDELTYMVNARHVNESTTPENPELDAFYAEMIVAARAELAKRQGVRTYRIIIETGVWYDLRAANDYLFVGTKAEFMAEYGLTGKHNPHRPYGKVTLPSGYVMTWDVQD